MCDMNTEVIWWWGGGLKAKWDRDRRDEITYQSLLHSECGDVEGTRSRPFPIHRHRMAIGTG